MLELDEQNEADSRLEDDLLMVVGIDDNGRVSQEDSYTAVMIEEVGRILPLKEISLRISCNGEISNTIFINCLFPSISSRITFEIHISN